MMVRERSRNYSSRGRPVAEMSTNIIVVVIDSDIGSRAPSFITTTTSAVGVGKNVIIMLRCFFTLYSYGGNTVSRIGVSFVFFAS